MNEIILTTDDSIVNCYYFYTIDNKGLHDSRFFTASVKDFFNEVRIFKEKGYQHIYASFKGVPVVNYYRNNNKL